MIYALLSLLNTILSYFDINVDILSYIGSVSLVTLVLLYTTSYVFNFKDTLSAGLTFKEITSVTVGDTTITKVDAGQEANNTYTLTQDGQNITITMNNFLDSNKNKAGQEIKVTYTATLNKDAVTGFDANKNSATVEYSNKPGTDNKGESEPSIVDVHTFNFTIFKY